MAKALRFTLTASSRVKELFLLYQPLDIVDSPYPRPNQGRGVLVIDDDPDCLEEYVESVALLGYRCISTSDPLAALRVIANDDKIEILIVDINLPGMDGLTFLDEVSARFTPMRPLASIVITGQPSLSSAIQAMRSNAIDFLPKPLALDQLAASLRRATTRLNDPNIISQLRVLAKRSDDDNSLKTSIDQNESPLTDTELQIYLRSIKFSSQKRTQLFKSKIISDPAWDMLLELTSAALEGIAVPTSSVCAATDAPFSTALRYIRQLVAEGHLRSWLDPADKRRTMLELEPATLGLMKAYLTSIRTNRKNG